MRCRSGAETLHHAVGRDALSQAHAILQACAAAVRWRRTHELPALDRALEHRFGGFPRDVGVALDVELELAELDGLLVTVPLPGTARAPTLRALGQRIELVGGERFENLV